MDAVAWSGIGLLAATLLGMLYYLGGRIEAFGHASTRWAPASTPESTASRLG